MPSPHTSTRAIALFQREMARTDLSAEARRQIAAEFAAAAEEMDRPRWATNPGPQAAAYLSEADETYFGGSAGGSKTALLLGLALTAHTKTLILRQTGADLVEVKDQLQAQMFPGDSWKSIGNGGEFRTYDGRKIELLGCDDEKRAASLQGRPHDMKCVARGTPIRMGDGTLKAIESIRVGDFVMTLQGPRRVLRHLRMGVKPCWRVRVDESEILVAETHRMLASDGWVAPSEAQPTRRRAGLATPSGYGWLSLAVAPLPESRRRGRRRRPAVAPAFPGATPPPASVVWSVDGRTGTAGWNDSLREVVRLPELSVRLVLHAPAPRSAGWWSRPDGRECVPACGRRPASVRGSRCGCRAGCGSCGGRDGHPVQAGGPGRIPSPTGATDTARSGRRSDGPGRTPERTRSRLRFRHPYTMAWEVSSEPVLVREARMAPAGAAEVFDLTVESAAHYISGEGIVHKNCYDELPQFSEKVYRRVNAWLRTTEPGQRCRVVGAGNPPLNVEEEWVLKYWGPWLDDQHPEYPAPPGALRWFISLGDRDEQVESGDPVQIPVRGRTMTVRPTSRTFIPATLDDNPDLRDSGYREKLLSLHEPMRSQLLFGDMTIGRSDDEQQVIPTDWVMRSMNRSRALGKRPSDRLTCSALDPAKGGADNMALAKRYDRWIDPLWVWPGKAVTDENMVELVRARLDHLRSPLVIDVGANPGGTAVASFKLKHKELPVVPVNFASASTFRDRSGRLEMANLRAEAYWRMREALDPSMGPEETRLVLPYDMELKTELCMARYKPNSKYVQLEPKEKIVERLGRSPDRADAAVMTLLSDRPADGGWVNPVREAKPPQEQAFRPVSYGRPGGGFMGVPG